MNETSPTPVRSSWMRALRRYLVAGMLVWVPIGVTLLIVRFFMGLMEGLLRSFLTDPVQMEHMWLGIPGVAAAVSLVLTVTVLIMTGLLVTNLLGRQLVEVWEGWLQRIPVVRSVYSGAKTFAETIFSKKGKAFKEVVLVEFPLPGTHTIGFLSAQSVPEVAGRTGVDVVGVYVPTAPLPTTGFVLMVPRAKLIHLDMTVDQAMKMIVTLGVVTPPWPSHTTSHAPGGRLASPGPSS
ncbi:MAG TPA: DUF502 domain-containing protein [Steroidobacteraceae bacterium]|nr:DUF502 domain-containing protein [Steroidobacteraceae bacterium]